MIPWIWKYITYLFRRCSVFLLLETKAELLEVAMGDQTKGSTPNCKVINMLTPVKYWYDLQLKMWSAKEECIARKILPKRRYINNERQCIVFKTLLIFFFYYHLCDCGPKKMSNVPAGFQPATISPNRCSIAVTNWVGLAIRISEYTFYSGIR